MALKRLAKAARAFIKKYPFVKSSDGAFGRCLCSSRDFIREQKIGRLLYLSGSRLRFPDRNPFYKNYADPDPALFHAVVEYKGLVLDISRRQFQPRCRVPFIQPLTLVRKQWHRVTSRLKD
jgi:hypothetical protein